VNPLSVVVRTICDVFAWFLGIFGIYIIIHGHLTPGGGFQGGAVVATMIAFLLVSHGGRKVIAFAKHSFYSSLETVGLLLFICAGFFGITTTFFYNFLAGRGGFLGSVVETGSNSGVLNSAGTISLMNMAVGLEVIGGLSLIVLYMFKGIRMFDNALEGGETGHDR
jgi:multicomponent Na+:H+ antiporter subunit B